MEKTSEIKGYDGIFATRFREMLKLRGYTQRYVAEQTVSKGQTISQYFNGEVLPNAEKLRDIALCLDVSADYLLGMSDILGSNVDDKAINKMLGLSEKAIARLKREMDIASECVNNPGGDGTCPPMAFDTVNALLEEPVRLYYNGILENLAEIFAHIHEQDPHTVFGLTRFTVENGDRYVQSDMPQQPTPLTDADVLTIRMLKLQQAVALYKSELDAKSAGGGQ